MKRAIILGLALSVFVLMLVSCASEPSATIATTRQTTGSTPEQYGFNAGAPAVVLFSPTVKELPAMAIDRRNVGATRHHGTRRRTPVRGVRRKRRWMRVWPAH